MEWTKLKKSSMSNLLLISIPIILAFTGAFTAFSCLADDSTGQSDVILKSDMPTHTQPLPDIIAKTYTFRIEKRSHSNRIYIFEEVSNHPDLSPPDPSPNETQSEDLPLPHEGETLLLKEGRAPVMGFRVLKAYPEKNQIAVKRIRRYKKHPPLKAGQIFTGIEKITDYFPLDLTHEEEDELAELETEKQDKNEAEAHKKAAIEKKKKEHEKKTPLPDENKHTNDNLQKFDDLDALAEERDDGESFVEEGNVMDPYRHWLSAGFGFTVNSIPPSSGSSGSALYAAGNFRYGYSFAKYILFNKPTIQDSLTVEGGAFYYKINTYISGYTVLSYIGDLRYNMFFSEKIAIFFYGGVIKPVVLSSSNAQSGDTQALSGTVFDGGLGLLFQIGPSWYLRLEAGTNILDLNLVVRF